MTKIRAPAEFWEFDRKVIHRECETVVGKGWGHLNKSMLLT